VTVDSLSEAPTSATANPPSVCSGSPATLTVNGGKLGSGAKWKWYAGNCSGTAIDSGISITVSPTIATTYYVRAEGKCNTTGCASVLVGMNTISVAPAGASASNSTICNGGATTLYVNGGTIGYDALWHWYSGSCGGTAVDTGNSISVSPIATTNYYVRAEGACNATTCASVSITVLPAFGTGNITGGDGTICNGGDPTVMIVNPVGGAGTYAYQWYYRDGTSAPTDANSTALTGATSQSYDPPVGLTNSRTYGCKVDATGTPDCGGWAWASNSVTVTVLPVFSTGSIAGGGGTICYSGDPGPMTGNPSGGTGTYSYQWYYRDGTTAPDDGTNTLITGATNQTYDPPAGLTNTRTFHCKVDAAGTPDCGNSSWVSNSITVTVLSPFSAGSIAGGGGGFCIVADPGPMTANPSGGTGSYSYQWYYCDGTAAPDDGTNTLITDAISQTYDPPAGLTNTRTYRCKVDAIGSPDCGAPMWTSNGVTNTVRPKVITPVISFEILTGGICSGMGVPYNSQYLIFRVATSTPSVDAIYYSIDNGISYNAYTVPVTLAGGCLSAPVWQGTVTAYAVKSGYCDSDIGSVSR
jgi:hypothetical protein